MLCLYQVIWIVAALSVQAQVSNDECTTATIVPEYISETFECLSGTTKQALPDVKLNSPCQINSFAVVWYRITDFHEATHFSLQVKSTDDKVIMMQLYGAVADCDDLTPLSLSLNDQYCRLSLNGEIDIVAKLVEWPSYYIAVTVLDPEGGDFSVCTNFILQDVACAQEKSLTVTPTIFSEIYQRPFSTGQTLDISMSVNSFSPVNNGCQWFQGLVPVFGSGWSDASFDGVGEPIESRLNGISTQSIHNGLYGATSWSWFEGVDYHGFHPYYQVGYFDFDSRMDLCHTVYQKDCPEQGGLTGGCCSPCWNNHGTYLPGGWFAYGINGSCSLPGPPVGYDWGDGNSCGNLMGPWNFEYQLEIKSGFEYICEDDNMADELTIGFFTFTDGEIGSWVGGAEGCAFDAPIVETLPVVCVQNVCEEEIISIPACNGDTVIIRPLDYYTGTDDVLFWGFYTREDNLGVSEGYLSETDSFQLVVSNLSTLYANRIPLYLYGYTGAQSVTCILRLEIVVYPEPFAAFTYLINGSEVRFFSLQSIDSSYFWDFGDGSWSFEQDPIHTYEMNGQYTVHLIVSSHCGMDTVYKTIPIAVAPIASFTSSATLLCVGDTLHLMSTTFMPQITYQWTIEGGIPSATDEPEIDVVYTDTGYFDIGLIVQNEVGADTLHIDSAVYVRAYPEVKYSVEVYDSLVVFNYLGNPLLEIQWWLEDSLASTELSWHQVFIPGSTQQITIKVFGECGADSITFDFMMLPVETYQINTPSPGIKIYPNPASNELFVFIDPAPATGRISLYDKLGQPCRQVKVDSYGNGFRLSAIDQLPRGLYILEVEIGGKKWYLKCVLQ
jgi:PKD repeat protein